MIVGEAGSTELFNLANDPYEKNNLATEETNCVESLTKILHTYAEQ